jgi:hypothetical protein
MRYKLAKLDYYKAYLLHIKPRQVYAILGVFVICMVVFACILAVLSSGGKHETRFVVTILLVAVFVLLSIYLAPVYSINKCFKQTKGLDSEIALSVSEDSFSLSTENSNVTIPYKDIFKVKSNEHYLLIYHNQYVYRVIPKQDNDLILAAGTIEERFKLVSQYVTASKRAE